MAVLWQPEFSHQFLSRPSLQSQREKKNLQDDPFGSIKGVTKLDMTRTTLQRAKKNEDPNKELPTLTQMFERTHKRTDGRTYDTYDDTARKINYKPLEDGSDAVDPYMVVMNKENDGFRRDLWNHSKRMKLKEMRKEIQEDHERTKAELEDMQINFNKHRENFEAMMRKFMEQQSPEGR